jgi:acylphosphatase
VPGLSRSGTVRRRLVVTGRVQGVWFRESCRRAAVAAGATGWARNLADGTVEVEVEGSPAAVERVVAWCRQGPDQARVDRVEVERRDPIGERAFRVR